VIFLSALKGYCLWTGTDPEGKRGKINSRDVSSVQLTVVYDNYLVDPGLQPAWGFACVVSSGDHRLLFDTGGDSAILLRNLRALGIDPSTIDRVAISHLHQDHLGGLEGFLGVKPDVNVYIPGSFPNATRETIQSAGATVKNIRDPEEMAPGVYSTGELGIAIREQSLIIHTLKGLVVMTGCAHPGIVRIVTQAKELFPQQTIYLVMGGFHLSGASKGTLQDIIRSLKELGVQKVAPSHCSGDLCRDIMQRAFAKDFIANGAGGIICIPEEGQMDLLR
ncbi:MAG: MBL fold metallo-hydrolase, partial [Calditrichota bacterium]